MKDKIKVFGITIDNLTLDDVLERIDKTINEGRKGYVVTPNVDHVVQLSKDKNFRTIYDQAELVLNDSVILKRSAQLLGHQMCDKLSGSDLLPLICAYAEQKRYRVYFLGGMPGVAEKAKEKLVESYADLKITGTYSPPFGFEQQSHEIKQIIKEINKTKPEILFVGLGAPKQEIFAYNYINQLDVNVIFCTGAAFDFQAGHVKRAPKIMQKLGMEWFYRFLKEPKRLFKRYFVNDLKFFLIFAKELLNR